MQRNTADCKEKIHANTFPDYRTHRSGHSLFRKHLLLLLPRSAKGFRNHERPNALLLGLVSHLDRANWLIFCPVYAHCGNGIAAGGWHRIFLYRGLVGAPGIPIPAGCGFSGLQAQQRLTSGEKSEQTDVCRIDRHPFRGSVEKCDAQA